MRNKLETYQKNFLDFICGNPTRIKVLGQGEEIEAGLSGTFQEEEVQTKESQDLKSGVAQEEVQLEKPQDLRGRGQKEKELEVVQEQQKVEVFLALVEEISKIQHLDIEPQIELTGEEIGNAKQNIDIGPLVFVQIGIRALCQGTQMFKRI